MREWAKRIWAGAALALIAAVGGAKAEPALPLAPHRAAYEISLVADDDSAPSNGQAVISANGLIAYEFRGSACEGYAANFRQVTELQRSEGDPVASDVRSITFEDGAGKTMRFEIEGQTAGADDPTVSGTAARGEDGLTTVDLAKPEKSKLDIGKNILFPTQHVAAIISAAKAGETTLQARVYDGSDTGKKVFATFTVIGKPTTGSNSDSAVSDKLEGVKRWPVTISYFDEATPDRPADYTLGFDLYENGVSGSLKLDYGTFALAAKLAKVEWLPSTACDK